VLRYTVCLPLDAFSTTTPKKVCLLPKNLKVVNPNSAAALEIKKSVQYKQASVQKSAGVPSSISPPVVKKEAAVSPSKKDSEIDELKAVISQMAAQMSLITGVLQQSGLLQLGSTEKQPTDTTSHGPSRVVSSMDESI